MNFCISVLDLPIDEVYGEKCMWCQIQIGGFSERFSAPVELWSINEYISQWKCAVEDIANGASKGFLMAAMRNPDISDFLSVYTLYREADEVFVQNQIVLCNGNEEYIRRGDFIQLIEDRETETEDGEKISEWRTTVGQLKYFLEQLK